MKSGGVKLVLWAQTFLVKWMRSCMWFTHVSKLPICGFSYNGKKYIFEESDLKCHVWMYELVISIFSLFLQYFSWISELCRHWDSVVYFAFHFIADKNCADTQTVWYILFFILLLTRTVLTLRQCGIFCFPFYCWQELCWHSDSVVYFVFHFIADKDLVNFLMS
jgi:hypothetical protein